MFKDFTMRATHTQTLRALQNQEAEDYLATAFSMATNLAVVTGLAYARSKFVFNKKNEYQHNKYMGEYLKPESLTYIAFMRSSMFGAPLSYANDVAEAYDITPVPSIRTTTNRYKRKKGTDEIVGNYLMQLPAVKTGTDFIGTGKDVLLKDKYTQEDFKKLMGLLPGQNFILMMRLRDELAERTNLPKVHK